MNYDKFIADNYDLDFRMEQIRFSDGEEEFIVMSENIKSRFATKEEIKMWALLSELCESSCGAK